MFSYSCFKHSHSHPDVTTGLFERGLLFDDRLMTVEARVLPACHLQLDNTTVMTQIK